MHATSSPYTENNVVKTQSQRPTQLVSKIPRIPTSPKQQMYILKHITQNFHFELFRNKIQPFREYLLFGVYLSVLMLFHFRTKFFPNETKRNGVNERGNGAPSAKTNDLSTPTPAIRQSLGPNTATLYSKTTSSIHRTNKQNQENQRRSKVGMQFGEINETFPSDLHIF